jgi:NADH-quinone oxidoreductase subunit G
MSAQATVTIDGTKVTVPAGTNLIEAARRAGISVPHYCYHPRLTVAGNCRVCLVEVEGMPKLQIACNTGAREGMVVHTANERVKGARAGVMEFLLINHPLDCTICDQAGECKLQEYAVDHGTGVTRFEENKVRKPKNVSWGDRVVFDSERCILCTRCVRFLGEVAGTPEVSVDERGDRSTLVVKGDGKLTSPYQMNVIDLCPVGALTSRDFRFKSRVWFMKFVETVCTSCARGCNVVAGFRGDRMLRMVPRHNAEVNDHWMCDHGRLHYAFVNDAERLTNPRVGGREAPYGIAIARAAEILRAAKGKGVLVVASPFMTNEELFGMRLLADAVEAEERRFRKPIGEGDRLLVHPEKCPNARGAALAGFQEWDAALENRDFSCILYAAPREGAALPAPLLAKAARKIVLSLRDLPADVCLPLTEWVEKDGTVVSAGDRLQRILKGMTFDPSLLTERAVLDRILQALDPSHAPADTAAQAFRRIPWFQGIEWSSIGAQGRAIRREEAKA